MVIGAVIYFHNIENFPRNHILFYYISDLILGWAVEEWR